MPSTRTSRKSVKAAFYYSSYLPQFFFCDACARDTVFTEDGYTGDTYCTGCNQTLVSGSKIAATGHKGGVATCSEKAICDICHATYGEKDPNHHASLKKVDSVPASVTERGNTDYYYYYCNACEGYFRDGEAFERVERSAVILENCLPR